MKDDGISFIIVYCAKWKLFDPFANTDEKHRYLSWKWVPYLQNHIYHRICSGKLIVIRILLIAVKRWRAEQNNGYLWWQFSFQNNKMQ